MAKVSESDKLDGIAEARAVTGASERTLARAVAAGSLVAPVYVLGRRRWKRSDLIAWRDAQAAKPRRIGRPWPKGVSGNPLGPRVRKPKPEPAAEAP